MQYKLINKIKVNVSIIKINLLKKHLSLSKKHTCTKETKTKTISWEIQTTTSDLLLFRRVMATLDHGSQNRRFPSKTLPMIVIYLSTQNLKPQWQVRSKTRILIIHLQKQRITSPLVTLRAALLNLSSMVIGSYPVEKVVTCTKCNLHMMTTTMEPQCQLLKVSVTLNSKTNLVHTQTNHCWMDRSHNRSMEWTILVIKINKSMQIFCNLNA